jgi:hypothetical protein
MAAPAAIAPVNAAQVGWAALFARVNNRATPALIQKWMGVGPDHASALMSELVKRNVIHTPIAGSAVSVQPMFPNSGIPGFTKSSGQVLRKARDVLDALSEVEETADPDLSEPKAFDETA